MPGIERRRNLKKAGEARGTIMTGFWPLGGTPGRRAHLEALPGLPPTACAISTTFRVDCQAKKIKRARTGRLTCAGLLELWKRFIAGAEGRKIQFLRIFHRPVFTSLRSPGNAKHSIRGAYCQQKKIPEQVFLLRDFSQYIE
jgi:hypothetical protein